MNHRTFELISPLSPAECTVRLSAAINIPADGYDRLWNGSGNASIRGTVYSDNFSLSVKVPGRNFSSLTRLVGTLRSEGNGTSIDGQCIFDPEFRKVLWGASACAIFIGIPIILLLVGEFRSGAIHGLSDLFGRDHQPETMGLLFLAGFNAIYPMAYYDSKFYSNVLTDFLLRTLETHSISRVQ